MKAFVIHSGLETVSHRRSLSNLSDFTLVGIEAVDRVVEDHFG
jgi:hypothetical protein